MTTLSAETSSAPPEETVMDTGTFSRGGVVSTTVTANVAEPSVPLSLVAVHVTVVVPSGKTAPDAGEQVIAAGVSGPSSGSEADAVNVTADPNGPSASRVVSLGTPTVGGVAPYLKENCVSFRFPALSLQLPDRVIDAPSGPE